MGVGPPGFPSAKIAGYYMRARGRWRPRRSPEMPGGQPVPKPLPFAVPEITAMRGDILVPRPYDTLRPAAVVCYLDAAFYEWLTYRLKLGAAPHRQHAPYPPPPPSGGPPLLRRLK